jgi:hypothetical protein
VAWRLHVLANRFYMWHAPMCLCLRLCLCAFAAAAAFPRLIVRWCGGGLTIVN